MSVNRFNIDNPTGEGFHWSDTGVCVFYEDYAKLKAENAALVEAIQTHKDSIIGQEEPDGTEDEALWAVLPKENDK